MPARRKPLSKWWKQLSSILPAVLAPTLAVIATVAELVLGVALILGVFKRPVAWARVILLGLFAGAMISSFGVKAPLSYSVFVDLAASFALCAWPATPNLPQEGH